MTLAERLAEAAELEHGLLCQYLFAAFSFKRSHEEGVTWEQLEKMRRWQGSILTVARQEMEHLGYVCNMLTAIGQVPYLVRPNFPLGPRRYELGVECKLERFGGDALRRFILFEIPQAQSPDELEQLERELPDVAVAEHQTIGGLYEEIKGLFATPGAEELFVGPPTAQTTDERIGMRGLNAGEPGPIYDVLVKAVTDVQTADEAIEQIIREGEGGPLGAEKNSHFARFCTIASELEQAREKDPSFDPARPVVSDPDRPGMVSREKSVALCDLFDLAYASTVVLLARFFAQAGESLEELAALQHVVFFPMMTTVVRPLGEMLTELPAEAGGGEVSTATPRAGARFTFTRALAPLPHHHAAWSVIGDQLELLGQRASELAADPAYPARLSLMAENLQRMAGDFRAAVVAQP